MDEPEQNWQAPESLLEFIKSGSQTIYIGFGSIIVPDPIEFTNIIVEAVKLSGVRAIICKGWSGRGQKTQAKYEYPSQVYVIDKVPHDWLFPQMAGVFHHGGAGTTAAGLRAGVPTLIKPFFGDQHFWAARVQELGVGMVVRKFTVEKLARYFVKLCTESKLSEKSALIGEKIRSEDGVENAIQFIYRDLDLAKKRFVK